MTAAICHWTKPASVTTGLHGLMCQSCLQLIERASEWANTLGIDSCVNFRVANATIHFDNLLSTYPGPLQLVAIQWCACTSTW